MSEAENELRHNEINLAGFRAHGATVGLIQILKELRRSGALDESAISRVRNAVADELALKRPLRADADQFRERIRNRLDRLLAPDP